MQKSRFGCSDCGGNTVPDGGRCPWCWRGFPTDTDPEGPRPFAMDKWGHEYAEGADGTLLKRAAGSSVWRFEATSRAHFDRYRGLTLDDPIYFVEVEA